MVSRCICMLIIWGLAIGNSALAAGAQRVQAVPEIAALEPELEGLYRDLHEHPELAFHEERTAAALAERLRALGFEVTTGVGHTGLVAILRNGSGPVVMLRTELDALPIEEKTGLPFASKSKGLDSEGKAVPVSHACGHDLHMTGWYRTAKTMARRRNTWHGTRMLMSVRSYDEKVRKHLLESIKRQLDAEAAAVDAPSPPSIKVIPGAEAVYNDPEVTARLVAALRRDLGPDSAVEMPAKMTSEDFSAYGHAGVPAVLLHLGAVNPPELASGAKLQ